MKEFLLKLEKIYSKEDLKIIEKGFSTPKRKTSFRVNTLKSTNEEIEKYLQEKGIKFEKVNFLENAYILYEKCFSPLQSGEGKPQSNFLSLTFGSHLSESERIGGGLRRVGEVSKLDIFTDGKIYLQSISSQIPVELLNIQTGDKILDITASPGGKTSQAAAKLNNSGEIIAVDNNQIRIDKLKFTLERQGVKNTKIIKSDARNISKNFPEFEGYFDKIIADLPCSAEGKFNLNNEKSFAYWNEGIVKKNYKLQKEIMKSIIPLLKNGGELVYSTCTISPEENEDIVHMILCNFAEMQLEEIELDYEFARKGILKFENKSFKKDLYKTLRILPSPESEGFFVAKFRKD